MSLPSLNIVITYLLASTSLNGPIRYDPDRLASLPFNPLLSETYKKFSLCGHFDPDANFFSELVDCEYYTQ